MWFVFLLQYCVLGLAQEIQNTNNYQPNEYGPNDPVNNFNSNNYNQNPNGYPTNPNGYPTNPNFNMYNTVNYNTNTYVGSSGYYEDLKCPEHWYQFQDSCYRFIKSPLKAYNEAKRICQVGDFKFAKLKLNLIMCRCLLSRIVPV